MSQYPIQQNKVLETKSKYMEKQKLRMDFGFGVQTLLKTCKYLTLLLFNR